MEWPHFDGGGMLTADKLLSRKDNWAKEDSSANCIRIQMKKYAFYYNLFGNQYIIDLPRLHDATIA